MTFITEAYIKHAGYSTCGKIHKISLKPQQYIQRGFAMCHLTINRSLVRCAGIAHTMK